MAVKKSNESRSGGIVTIQLNLVGLAIISLALVAAAALVTYGLLRGHYKESDDKLDLLASVQTNGENSIAELPTQPAAGQLIVRDLNLEQPDEYAAYETATNRDETWTFENMAPGQVRALMQSCGLAADEIDRALSAPLVSYVNSNTTVTPDAEIVFSMSPQVRVKLYNALAHYSENELMRFPICFEKDIFDAWFGGGRVDDDTLAMLKKLTYVRGDTECFSDLDILLQRVPDDDNRLRLVKALSRQSALLVGIQVWPDTDLDKLIGYWSWPAGVRLINVRPLLESLKSRPHGGAASILYFLPPFARERLYTYPLPSQLGDPTMDCHWSTMNFFNETPDNRFSDPKYTSAYIAANYYQIAKPSAYGDIILLLDDHGNAIHSGVYLADDIIFTKNGNNFAQPWMLMHLKDLVAEYTTDVAPRIATYRNKNW